MTDIDYSQLDTGIRDVVRMLRANGFITIDSGDGSKAVSMECAVPYPMVAMRVDVSEMVSESHRLLTLLADAGECGWDIQASYNPASGSADILITQPPPRVDRGES